MFKRIKKMFDRLGSPELDWVQVEITSHCNANCIYCPNHLIAPKQHMPFDLFKHLLPYLVYTDLVYLQGWGEPLLNTAIFEMISACKKKGKRVGFTTNGMLLTDETIRKLVDLEVDIICISLAGTRPDTHNRIRKGTDFSKIIANIKRLQAIKAQKKSPAPAVHIAYLMLDRNFDDVSTLVELAKSLNVKEVVASNLTLIIDTGLWPEALFNVPEKYAYYTKTLEAVAEEARKSRLSFAYHLPNLEREMKSCNENVISSCVIGVKGDVSPCVFMVPTLLQTTGSEEKPVCHIFKGNQIPLSFLSFGNISAQSLTRIWNQEAYVSFRKLFDPENPDLAHIPESQNCLTCFKGLNV